MRWMVGSATPTWSTRLRMTSRLCSTARVMDWCCPSTVKVSSMPSVSRPERPRVGPLGGRAEGGIGLGYPDHFEALGQGAEHDVSARLLGPAHDLGHQLIPDSAVRFGGDVGKDPRVSGRVEGSACSDLAFASRAQDEC